MSNVLSVTLARVSRHLLFSSLCCTPRRYYGSHRIACHYRLPFPAAHTQTKQTVDKLQTLVSTDGRFRNMREALHRCDPPCIPYLGMYLTDLSFIEEGTPNFSDEGLLNFSKMRMVSAAVRAATRRPSHRAELDAF